MRDLLDPKIDKYRLRDGPIVEYYKGDIGDSKSGAFMVGDLKVIAAYAAGWEHVSVSVHDQERCPTWEEMEKVKRMFFKNHELALQFHVPVSQHININEGTLHLWRHTRRKTKLPPRWMV